MWTPTQSYRNGITLATKSFSYDWHILAAALIFDPAIYSDTAMGPNSQTFAAGMAAVAFGVNLEPRQ
jgi:hypothetical protein